MTPPTVSATGPAVAPGPAASTDAASPSAPRLSSAAPRWWVRPGLEIRKGRLIVAGRDAESLARAGGTPLFVYDVERVAENARRIHGAMDRAGVAHRLRFALKSNREPEILDRLRSLGRPGEPASVGIDACSPGEVLHALANGWQAEEISFTGTNVSERDLDAILPTGIHLNLDAISQLERVGRRAPGRAVGIRVNPGLGAGYHEGLEYSGDRPTKFGIYEERLDEALAVAARHRLTIDTLHFHAGSGWLADGLAAFEAALAVAARLAERLIAAGCPMRELNVGGGLGVAARDDEPPVDLDAYAVILARHLGPLGVVAGLEPGDYLVKDSAILLGEVVTIERRRDVTFVGLDLGWNVVVSYFAYKYAQELVVCRAADAERTELVTVAGHINEAGDLFAEDYPLPPIAEGDIVAILNAGGYAQAMSMTHCLRPLAGALFLDRDPAP
jgi:diaminopimelate decarboxylase